MWRTVLLFVAIVVCLVGIASADTACVAGTLATIHNTTCSVAGVQFTFGDFIAHIGTYPITLGFGFNSLTQIDPSSITFTPYINGNQVGFTFAGLPNVSDSTMNHGTQAMVQISFASNIAGFTAIVNGARTTANTDASSGATAGASALAYIDVCDATGQGPATYNIWQQSSRFGSSNASVTSGSYQVFCSGDSTTGNILIGNDVDIYNYNGAAYIDVGSGSGTVSAQSQTFFVTVPEPTTFFCLVVGGLMLAPCYKLKRLRPEFKR